MGNFPAFTQRDRLLLLAPHPDDEALAAAGALRRAARAGASVHVIFLTDGDKNPWPQRVIERRWRVDGCTARQRWGALRRREALASLAVLGHGPEIAEFWSLPDQGLTRLLLSEGAALIARLSRAITSWQPTWLIAPVASDRHPDHSALGVATALALRERARYGYENPATLAYVVHGERRAGDSRQLGLVLDDGEVAAKRRAILCHGSQTLLSRRRFLAHASSDEVYFPKAMADRAESNHPLQLARWNEAGININVASRLPAGLLGGRELQVLLAFGTGDLQHLRQSMPRFARSCALRLPPGFLELSGSSVFIKLETGPWLYDAAGWVELRADTFLRRPRNRALLYPAQLVAPGSAASSRDLQPGPVTVVSSSGTLKASSPLLPFMAFTLAEFQKRAKPPS
jgi:LmbE family N-acetylglucosaminyl deacetylase